MTPKQIVEKWVSYFNDQNIDGLMALYAEKAINHQVVFEPLEGRDNIRRLFEEDFARAEMVCVIENLYEDGEWAIMEWSDPNGLRGCGFFHIVDSQILLQRGYFDQLTFFRKQGIEVPESYL